MIVIGPGMNSDLASCYGRTQNVVHNCVLVWICSKNLKTVEFKKTERSVNRNKYCLHVINTEIKKFGQKHLIKYETFSTIY